jgi:DNA sulfur modification protein DndC
MGPLTFQARLMGLERVLQIEDACNEAARVAGRPEIDILNDEEHFRILALIKAGTWPNGWDGDEPLATEILDTVYQNGAVQPLLFKEPA